MKSFFTVSFLAILMLILAGCQGSASPVARGKVVVKYVEPDKFTDVQSSSAGSTDEGCLAELRHFLEDRAGRAISPEQTLTLTFTDIDLAGQFEPHRLNLTDVRIVKNIYPARMTFRYAITDASGTVVKQAEEKLSDLAAQMQTPLGRSDPLYHEKELLSDWIRRTLR